MQKVNYMAPMGMMYHDTIPHVAKEEKSKLAQVNEAMKPSDDDEYEWNELPSVAGKLNLGMSATISALMANPINIGNKRKRAVLEKYQQALYNGTTEEMLVESFLNEAVYSGLDTGIATGYDSEIGKLRKRVDANKVEIDLLKILETMSQTNEAFIVPLIEDQVVKYVKNKNAQNRAMLRMALDSFSGYEFVQQMIEAIELDRDIKNYAVGESFISTQDKLKLLHEQAAVEDVYSPVDVLNGAAIFNVNGTFYSKRGNIVSKLSVQDMSALDESFVQLCNLVNDERVSVNEDHIDLFMNNKHVKIYESYAEIEEGKKETAESLRHITEMQMAYGDFDMNFWMMTSCLLENYSKIANVNFVKHISVKGDDTTSIDLFRLNETLAVAANSAADNSHVLYKNLNPMQCANVMNEHLGMCVSSLFEDLMPAQDKALLEVAATQKKYEDAIAKYDDAISKLEDARDAAESDKDAEEVDAKIKEIEKSRDDMQAEYDAWQEEASKMFEPEADDEGDEAVKKEEFGEPMSAKEAEDAKDELSTPLTDEAPAEGEPVPEADEEEPDEDMDYDEFMNKEIQNVLDSDYYNGSEEIEEEPEDELAQDKAVAQAFADETSSDASDDEVMPVEEPVEPEAPAADESGLFSSDIEKEPAAEDVAQVVDVTFNENVKTGESSNQGTVLVKVPSINPDGTKVADVKAFAFTVDNNGEVIVGNDESVSAELYNSIVDAVKADAKYTEVSSASTLDDENPDDFFTYEEGEGGELASEVAPAEEGAETASYQDEDGTTVDMPAASEDPAAIHESLISIKPVYKKLNEKLIDIEDDVVKTKPVEDDPDEADAELGDAEEPLADPDEDIIESHYDVEDVFNAIKETIKDVASDEVEIEEGNLGGDDRLDSDEDSIDVPYIAVSVGDEEDDFEDDPKSYTIYAINGKIYYRRSHDFNDIADNMFDYESLDNAIDELKKDYNGAEDLPSYDPDNIEGIKEMIGDILASLGVDDLGVSDSFEDNIGLIGDESKLDEKLVIKKKTSLSGEDKDESLLKDEIVNGSEDEQEEERELEDAEKNESAKPKLPNQRDKANESLETIKRDFHPGDEVIYKPLNTKVQIIDQLGDGTYSLLLSDGTTCDGVTKSQIDFADNLSLDNTPKQFDFDQDNLTRNLDVAQGAKHQDLNKRIPVNVVVDGYRLNNESCSALLRDIMSKRTTIHVINEDGIEDLYPRENVQVISMEAEKWPWAVYTLAIDDEPDRKVRVDPKSFTEAESDDDMVRCFYNEKVVELPKHAIKIMA